MKLKPACLTLLGALALTTISAAASAPSTPFRFVSRVSQPNLVKLPASYKTCDGDKDTVVVESSTTVWKNTKAAGPERDAEKKTQCEDSHVKIELYGAALRKADIKEFAFNWDSKSEGQLEVYLELKSALDQQVLASTKLGLVGSGTTASFQGYDPASGLAMFRFAALEKELARSGGQLLLLPATGEDLRDAETGEPWSQQLDPNRNWLIPSAQAWVRFAKPQQSLPGTLVRALLPSIGVTRFVDVGSLECGTGKEPCTLTRSEDRLFMETEPATLPKLVGSLVLSTTVNLLQARSGHLLRSDLSVRLAVTECVYELKQLTRVEAGRSEVDSLFELKRPRGSVRECAETVAWDVIAKKSGTSEVLASGGVTVDDGIAHLAWQSLPVATPNARATYELELKYPGGQIISTATVPKLVVDPAVTPTANVRAFTTLGGSISTQPANRLIELTARKALAVERENMVELAALRDRTTGSQPGWTLTVVGAHTFFPVCTASAIRSERASGSPRLCINPSQATDEVLQVRASEHSRVRDVLLPGVRPESLGVLADKTVELGWLEVTTQLSAKPYRVAQNLERNLSVVCGNRVIDGLSFGQPRAVAYDAFDKCRLVLDARISGFNNARALIDSLGTQSLEVSAGPVPTDKSVPKLELLDHVKFTSAQNLEPCPDREKSCLSEPLRMRKAAGGDAADYAMVQIEVRHAQDWYEATAVNSHAESALVVRVRRRPRLLTFADSRGYGGRAYATFTVAPLTLFRAPHSGRKVWKSSDAAKLEAATFGTGLFGIFEPWDFDSNAPYLPFLNPQLQVGVLTTLPTTTALDYPSVSLVAGIGVRSGLDTSPDATVESSLKFLVWTECLWALDGRRGDPSLNLLFGLGVDLGSFGN